MYHLFAQFNVGFKLSKKDAEQLKINHARSGRPREAVTKDLIAHVEAIVQKDPHATLDEIAVEAGISHGSVHVILKEHLRMAKLCARWIPHVFDGHHNRKRSVWIVQGVCWQK